MNLSPALSHLCEMLYWEACDEAHEIGLSVDHDPKGFAYSFHVVFGLLEDSPKVKGLTDEERAQLAAAFTEMQGSAPTWNELQGGK